MLFMWESITVQFSVVLVWKSTTFYHRCNNTPHSPVPPQITADCHIQTGVLGPEAHSLRPPTSSRCPWPPLADSSLNAWFMSPSHGWFRDAISPPYREDEGYTITCSHARVHNCHVSVKAILQVTCVPSSMSEFQYSGMGNGHVMLCYLNCFGRTHQEFMEFFREVRAAAYSTLEFYGMLILQLDSAMFTLRGLLVRQEASPIRSEMCSGGSPLDVW